MRDEKALTDVWCSIKLFDNLLFLPPFRFLLLADTILRTLWELKVFILVVLMRERYSPPFHICEEGGEGKPCAAEGMDLIVIPPLFLWNLY
jgi:hypothetical protein